VQRNAELGLFSFFTARRYASAVYAMALCPFVTSRSSVERDYERIEQVISTEAFFDLSLLSYQKILASPKIRGHCNALCVLCLPFMHLANK